MFAGVAGGRISNVSHNIDADLGDFNGRDMVKEESSYMVRFKHWTGIAWPGAYLALIVFPSCFSAPT